LDVDECGAIDRLFGKKIPKYPEKAFPSAALFIINPI
jgi:hypothetical protein